MPARFLLLLFTVAALAVPSTASAEPLWDCTDVPYRVTPFSCFAYGAVEDTGLLPPS
jgi:hypothetical protein